MFRLYSLYKNLLFVQTINYIRDLSSLYFVDLSTNGFVWMLISSFRTFNSHQFSPCPIRSRVPTCISLGRRWPGVLFTGLWTPQNTLLNCNVVYQKSASYFALNAANSSRPGP